MYLHAGRAFGDILVVDLVQAEHLTGGTVELVMIDLDRGQGGVEGELNVRGLGRVADWVCMHGWCLYNRRQGKKVTSRSQL